MRVAKLLISLEFWTSLGSTASWRFTLTTTTSPSGDLGRRWTGPASSTGTLVSPMASRAGRNHAIRMRRDTAGTISGWIGWASSHGPEESSHARDRCRKRLRRCDHGDAGRSEGTGRRGGDGRHHRGAAAGAGPRHEPVVAGRGIRAGGAGNQRLRGYRGLGRGGHYRRPSPTAGDEPHGPAREERRHHADGCHADSGYVTR